MLSTTATNRNTITCLKVAYKAPSGSWRGFIHPFDISTEMSSKKEVLDELEQMLPLYEEMLSEENNPAHLLEKPLTNEQDKMVINKIIPRILKGVSVDEEGLYAETLHSN